MAMNPTEINRIGLISMLRCRLRFHEAVCSTATRHRQLKERLDEELQQEARAEEVLKAKVRSWESTGQLEHSKHFTSVEVEGKNQTKVLYRHKA